MTTFVHMPSLIQEQESDEDAATAAASLSSAASDEKVDLTSFGHIPSTPLLFSPLRTYLQQEMNGFFGGGRAASAAVALSAFLVSIWPPLCKFPRCG